MASLEEIRATRLEKLAKLTQAGMEPYPAHVERDYTLADVREKFASLSETGQTITIAGRVMVIRGQGAILFAVIFDGTDKLQAVFKKDDMEAAQFDLFTECADMGDFIQITGTLFTTQRGEFSILAKEWKMASKSLLPIPTEYFGIEDEDERLRKRYLDILLHPELAEMARKRSLFWNTIREYLLQKNFIEVETPVLENTTGGADARPFATHHNALNIDVFLRISAGELWQKKLLVAGIPRTFEIGRIFRNEGMSNEHLQDYTQLEYYMAYSDYEEGMEMTKELYRLIGQKVFGTTKFTIKGFEIDLADEWKTYDFVDILKQEYGIDALAVTEEASETNDKTLAEIIAAFKKFDIEYKPSEMNIQRGVDMLWKRVRKSIGGPGFLINVPVYLEPLAKRNRNNAKTVERFQVILAGSEMGKGFSELNDPVDQRGRFMEQQALRDAGDDEAQMADMDFVEALEYGMPPAFGFGMSERFISFLMDKPVRETQLFPLMRPKEEGAPKKKETMLAVAVLNSGIGLEKWQELNTVAHLNAAFGAHLGKQLFTQDTITSKDNVSIKLNTKQAIIIKVAPSSTALQSLARDAKAAKLEVDEFTREMIETTNDKKVIEMTAAKNYDEVEYLGVLVYGSKSEVEKLTGDLERYS